MASIKMSNLYPVGSELFKDSDSFMTELIDNELGSIKGSYDSCWCKPGIYSPLCKPSLPHYITTTLPPVI
ncbi:hypothetical protein [Nostoc flagelliforme]|uniref:hypothetical protein n=2 Tax=Nostoc flagelliforme TaxID=1306274 RepID=UPI0012FDC364